MNLEQNTDSKIVNHSWNVYVCETQHT